MRRPPLIEVLSSTTTGDGGGGGDDDAPPADRTDLPPLTAAAVAPSYGFCGCFAGFFGSLREDLPSIVELPDPDAVPQASRRALRESDENARFCAETYASDLYLDGDDAAYYVAAVRYVPFWCALPPPPPPPPAAAAAGTTSGGDDLVGAMGALRVAGGGGGGGGGAWTAAETDELLALPRKEYLIAAGGREERECLCGLATVIFSYALDVRLTGGDATVESGWAVATMSPTLSWLEAFNSPRDALVACVRRALVHAMIRRWDLAMLVCADVATVFSCGRAAILKCALGARRALARDELRYLLNTLYVTDYCVWIQSVGDASLSAFAAEVAEAAVSLTKAMTGLPLEEVEAAAAVMLGGGGDGGGGGGGEGGVDDTAVAADAAAAASDAESLDELRHDVAELRAQAGAADSSSGSESESDGESSVSTSSSSSSSSQAPDDGTGAAARGSSASDGGSASGANAVDGAAGGAAAAPAAADA